MNKLLIVTTVPITLVNFFLPFATHFNKIGWQVDAMSCGFEPGSYYHKVFGQCWDVQWSRNPLDPRNLCGTPGKIRAIALNEQYDIIHVHTPVAAFVTRYALKNIRKQLKAKIIYTAHGFHFHSGGNPLKNAIFLTLERLAQKWTDHLITINLEDRAAVKNYRLMPPDQTHYMPGIGVDLHYYNRDTVTDAAVIELRQELGISEKTPLLLSVAELNANKRHVDMLGAFAKLDRSDVHFAFVGNGPLQVKIEQLAIKLGVANRIHFLGRRSDIPVIMKAASANILVSGREGLPRTIMESLALEVPTIGTKTRGTQDLLTGGYGLLIEVGNVPGLTEAIAWILDRPVEADQMAKRGRKHLANYDINRIIKLHEELYATAMVSEIGNKYIKTKMIERLQ
jgi:glycosyltransferase involved in cell wall biosynthesis